MRYATAAKSAYNVVISGLVVGLLFFVLVRPAAAAFPFCSSANDAYNLAIIYLNHVPRKPDEAIVLLQRAAIAGHVRAQQALAMQLDYGFNVPRNQIGAYIWYGIAARAVAGPPSSWSEGCLDTADTGVTNFVWSINHRRDELAVLLPAEYLPEANRAVQTWKPGVGDPTQMMSVAGIPPSPPEPPPNYAPRSLNEGRQPSRSQPSTEAIPLQKRGNTYSLPVRINGAITLPFVLDTGSDDLVIRADVALTLMRAGALVGTDFIGRGSYYLANGSQVFSDRVVLREVQVGQHRVSNVMATINPPQSDLLLGQSFLSKFGTMTLDYNRLVLLLSR
jgi:hypothetical protein